MQRIIETDIWKGNKTKVDCDENEEKKNTFNSDSEYSLNVAVALYFNLKNKIIESIK